MDARFVRRLAQPPLQQRAFAVRKLLPNAPQARGDSINHQPIQMLPGTSAIGAPNPLNYQRPSVCPSFSVPSVVCLVDS